MRTRAILFVLAVIIGATAASWYGAGWAVRKLEEDTSSRVNVSLQAAGLKWASIETDGLIVRLRGAAPNETGRFRALEIAAQIVDTKRIQDETTIDNSGGLQAPDFQVEILRDDPELSLIGLLPGKESRLNLLTDLNDLRNEGQFTDLLESVEFDAPEGWEPALQYAVETAFKLPRSRILIRPGGVTIEAFLDDQEILEETKAALQNAQPEGIELRLDLSAPKQIVTPFRFAATVRDGRISISECWVSNAEGKLKVYSAAGEVSTGAVCQEALGVPSAEWAEAVATSILNLALMKNVDLEITDADVILSGVPGGDLSTFEAVRSNLEQSLPGFFSLTAIPPEIIGSKDAGGRVEPVFTASLDNSGQITIAGAMRDAAATFAAENLAAARFGHSRVSSELTVSEDIPAGWSPRVLASLDALALLHDGSLKLTSARLDIAGRTAKEDAQRIIEETLRNQLKDTAIQSEIEHVPALANVASGSNVPARECERQLAGVLREAQIIFDPNSSTISGESEILLDEIAYIISSCPDATFEIGGHTDSQGGEDMNRSLSQARADAVLDTLLTRDILLDQLTARGYGETMPIADNDTEDGRSRNRRIAFKLIESKEEANEQN